ncbi:DUF4301 family protein [Flavobacterium proteolyticum]|uniref:DUF4301 family protein n=1 Tax=Flavobacterium proteolyticum TaxID=2911683 RepID=A0ABR9WRU8_9FLAO|nr:DUF4301 family protein [Flavobacterium proteolyticum]MBE9575471.1 DUF4301 family protein [Flavobacterium proteolyticum]
MEKIFTDDDLIYIQNRGNSIEKIQQQLDFFIQGIPKINLVRSAKVGDGIWQFSEEETNDFVIYFDKHKTNYSIEKFVPASGAATRMFKFLNEFLNDFDVENDTINSYINKRNAKDISIFIFGLKNFPFYRELKEKTIQLYPNYYSLSNDAKYHALIKTLLSKEGLDFANKPKGILPFHVRDERIITPIEENIFESDFFKKENQKTKIHFTITEEFQPDFEKITNQFSECEISFSYQNQSTDTLAVNEDNTPFRVEDDKLFFRPGGHGALIDNLNALQSDIIFIKNIDNVSQNHRKVIETNKKLLGGVLLWMQYKIFNYLKLLSSGNVTEEQILEIKDFAENKTAFPLPEEFNFFQTEYKIEYLIKVLNRPIRVCGMVKNEGEPGGGPFWVQDEKGRQTLQIVESSQIDLNNKSQKNTAKEATHFNPVDIVCGVKNFKGEKFDLTQFVDPKSAFITEKTKNGKPIKAFELPGLWNGAMAKWTTIFVEVPLETFNPVKTVNDLLKPSHQPDNG